jgi:hypothetical protein
MRNTIKKILNENDFDWVSDINPASKEYIVRKVSNLESVGYRRDPETSQLTLTIHGLALNEEQINVLFKALEGFGDYCHGEGIDIGNQQGYAEGERDGYRYGYDDGFVEGKQDIDEELEIERERGYDEGYDEGMNDGYKKGYEEGVEVTYHKAFEEGRAYEAGIEVEDLERRESGFDPSEYDEDYDENY